MSELRWILLSLGVLLIAGLYCWGRKPFRKLRLAFPKPVSPGGEATGEAPAIQEPIVEQPRPRRRTPDKIVTLRVVCQHDKDMKSADAVLALKRFGLLHGKYGVFHRFADAGSEEPLFSVASLTEPGSFDLDDLDSSGIAGLSLFMVLPGTGDAVGRFDAMIQLARDLAEDLAGVVLDERGSSWSIQRERYIREEIIQFQHQISRT